MKQFFGAFFGSILGLLLVMVLAVAIIIGVIKSSISSTFKDKEEVTQVRPNSILKLNLKGEITERQHESPFAGLGEMDPFGDSEGLGLNTMIKKINHAKTDANIKGIYLCFRNMECGFAALKELRNSLADFKKSGKFIYSYAEDFGQKQYYLASVSDKVYLNPQGNIDWRGLSLHLLFFKKTFEKLEVEIQVFRHGKFKSAVEPFLLEKMSQANRFQSEIFLNSIWGNMLTDISTNRKVSVDDLNRMANSLSILHPEDAVDGLVDALAYEDEVVSALKKKIGIKDSDKMKFVEFAKYEAKKKIDVKLNSSRIAVIYANGEITDGEGDDEEIGSERLAKTIHDARLDDKVKGIVLRVNSPGGSALASDVIWREVLLAKQAKPTVVSMGDLAASGGYYISCAADRIFAQPNTITGSIGVFGIIPNLQKALENKLGITVDTVNTNQFSDVGSGFRHISEYEYKYIQSSVERVYDTFTKRVAEGRHMSQADVDSIGQGRVWTGTDALRIGLVDELGGLDEALAWVAKKAKLKDYKLVELPKQKSPFDALLGNKEAELESRFMKSKLGASYLYLKQIEHLAHLKGVQARLPFEMSMK
jgi:protease-4